MDVFEKLYLPVEQLPPSGGEPWTLVTGNAESNLWRRPGPVLLALEALAEWMRAHAPYLTGEHDPFPLLVAAREAVDAARAAEAGT